MFLTLIIAFISLIVLMIIHEFGHFIIAKKFGVKVEEFGIGYPPRIFGKKFGETLYSVNLIPLGAFVKIYGETADIDDYRSFSNLTIFKRALIVLGGVIAFWLAAVVIFSFMSLIGAQVPIGDQDIQGISGASVKITAVMSDSPAQISGIKPGDVLISYKAKDESQSENSANKISDFQDFAQKNKGKEVVLKVRRDNQVIDITLTPRLSYPPDQGPVGFALQRFADVVKKHPWYQAPVQGVIYTGKITWEAYRGLAKVFGDLFSGKGLPPEAQLAGPVGITIFLARAADFGLGFFLYFIGSLAVLVAIFNALPIPALDGGKLLFLLIESVKRKPVSVKTEQTITITFFAILILMSIFVTIKFDIPRVMEFWKSGL